MTLDFFLLADGDERSFQHELESVFRKLMTNIIDHNKRRCHGDGAVYFMHSMTPCILWSVILTFTGSSCLKCVPIAAGSQRASRFDLISYRIVWSIIGALIDN